MNNFKLTPTTKHYVNADGDRCEAALLNGVWVAVWGIEDDDGIKLITTHNSEGVATSVPDNFYDVYGVNYNITAEFTGWLSDPFDGAPEWAGYATCSAGVLHWWSTKPATSDIRYWHLSGGGIFGNFFGSEYIGNWRNSLVERKE